MTEVHFIYCALCFYRYYIVMCNEIIIHHFTTHHNAESVTTLSLFSCNQLGVMEDSDTQSVLLRSSLHCNLILVVTVENPASRRSYAGNRSRLFSAFYGNLRVFCFDFNKATIICDLKQLILF